MLISGAAGLLAGGGAQAQPGDPVSGESLFNARGCPACHGVANQKHLRAASLKLAQSINTNPGALHGGGPEPWTPAFTQTELRDLAAYLSSIDPNGYSVSGEVYAFGSPSKKLSNVEIEVESDYLPGATFAFVLVVGPPEQREKLWDLGEAERCVASDPATKEYVRAGTALELACGLDDAPTESHPWHLHSSSAIYPVGSAKRAIGSTPRSRNSSPQRGPAKVDLDSRPRAAPIAFRFRRLQVAWTRRIAT